MLEKSFLVAFIVLAIHGIFYEGMIFGKVRQWLAPLNDKIKKPLYDCCFCQTPWWGSAAYWIIWGNSWHEFIPVVLAAAGINFFISVFLPED